MSTPMKITIHSDDEGKEKTYSRTFVPWKLLKVAARIAVKIDPDDMSDEAIDELASLVAEAFGNQFSVQDVSEYGDILEMLTVLKIIMAKARGNSPDENPMIPG